MVATRARAAAGKATPPAKASQQKYPKAMTTEKRPVKSANGPRPRTAGAQSERKASQQTQTVKKALLKGKTAEEEEVEEETSERRESANDNDGEQGESSSSSDSEEEEKLLHSKLLRYDDDQEEVEDEDAGASVNEAERVESDASASEEDAPPLSSVKIASSSATPTNVQAKIMVSTKSAHGAATALTSEAKQARVSIISEQKLTTTATPKLMSYVNGGDSSSDEEMTPAPTQKNKKQTQNKGSVSKGNMKNVGQRGDLKSDYKGDETEVLKKNSELVDESDEKESEDDRDEASENEAGDAQSEDDALDEKKSTTSKGTKLTGIDRREAVLVKRLRNEVRRQAKTSKKYELRKIIRDIKTAKEKQKPDEKKVEKHEQKLAALKAIDVNEFAAKAMADMLQRAAKEGTQDDEDETEKPKVADTVEAKLESKLLEFKGLQAALKEFIERPKRERLHHERQKKRMADLAKKEAKKLERQSYALVCGIANCTAKFATEEARTVHRVKRHHTTGDLKADMAMGLRENRPGQRDRKAFALLKAGAAPEEVDKIRNPKKNQRPEEGEARKRERKTAADERPHSVRIGSELSGKKPTASQPERPVARLEKKRAAREETYSVNRREIAEKRPRTQSDTSASAPNDKAAAVGSTAVPGKAQKLHPSWEAKRKATQLVEFQGKAVEFSDDE